MSDNKARGGRRFERKPRFDRPAREGVAAPESAGETSNLLVAAADPHKSNAKPKHIKVDKPDFTPKAKASKPSADKDDPLNSDLLSIDGVKGYVRATHQKAFQLDLSQFCVVVDASYNAQVTCDRGLRKYLPPSAFFYYAVIALWRRILQIYSARGRFQVEYQALCAAMGDFEMVLPEDLLLYISGIGDVEDFSQRQWKMEVAAFPSIVARHGFPGHFERVDAQTHIYYETTPAPFVAVWRILSDMRRTILDPPHGPVIWNLPEDLAPQQEMMPNKNLLGWAPAVFLSQEQRTLFESSGISINIDGVQSFEFTSYAGIPVNIALLTAVSNHLLTSKFACTKTWVDTPKGSVSQIPYATRDTIDQYHGVFSSKTLGSACYSQAGSSCACAALTFRYRVERRKGTAYTDSLCYPSLDPAWGQNCNQVWQAGDVGLWNSPEFRVAETSGEATATALAIRVRKHVGSKTTSEKS